MKGGAYLALEASDQIAERWHKAAIPLAVATIVTIGAAYALVLPSILAAAIGLPLVARIVVAASPIAPLAFAMGLPFSLGPELSRC